MARKYSRVTKDIPAVCDSYTGTTTTALSAAQAFASVCHMIRLTAVSNAMIVNTTDDGTTYGDDIYIPKNVSLILELKTHSYKLKSAVAGLHATFHVEGYY